MISTKRRDQDAAKHFLAVVALVVAALMLAFSATPATVLADSAAEQYTEPQLPQTPPDQTGTNSGNSNGASNQSGGNGGGGNGGGGNGGGSASSEGAAGAPGGPNSSFTESGGAGSAAVPGGPDEPGSGATDQSEGADESKGGAGASEKRESNESEATQESEATLFGPGGSDDGGPTLWLIAALVLGIPLLVGGGYYLFRRYGRGRGDVQTQARVRDAVSLKEGRQKP
jgi:hypothetical protein